MQEREESTRRMFALHDQMVAKYEGELQETRAEITALRHENASLLRKLELTDVETARSQQAATQYTHEIQALMAQLKDMRELAQKLSNELNDVTAQRDNMQFMLDAMKTKSAEYENRLLRSESATTCQVELETRIARQNAVIKELQREASVAQETQRTLQTEIHSVRRTHTELLKEKEDLEIRLAEASNQCEGDHDELHRVRGESMRLRDQIQSMARLQVETLNKHLQTVEAKHRKHVTDLKDENTQRMNEVTTLQAKLAKAEWSVTVLERERALNPASIHQLTLGDSQGTRNPHQATLAIIETQQRTIQDLTSKNNELTISLEKAEMSTRKDLRQSRLDLEEARSRLEEASNRVNMYRREADEAKASLERQSEELSRVYNEVHTLKIHLEDMEKSKEAELHASRRQITLADEKHRASLEEQVERTKALDRKLQRTSESSTEREQKLKHDIQSLTDRYDAELTELRKARDDNMAIIKDLQGRLSQLLQQHMEKERECAQNQFSVQKLMQGLEAHKAQITQLSDKVNQGTSREQELRSQYHEVLLQSDVLRGQLERTSNERDVALTDLASLCALLKGEMSTGIARGKKSSRRAAAAAMVS